MRIPRIAVVFAVSAGMLVVAETTPVRGEDGMTLAALRIAYAREVNAQRAYELFAARAEIEGCLGVRDLLNAVSQGEQVHARIHAASLARLGAEPAASPLVVEVGSTPDNLRAAFESELIERGAVYERFAGYARAECMYDALAGFRYAADAEASHARAIADAYFRLAEMSAPRAYVLCAGCGGVAGAPAAGRCPCGAPSSMLSVVRGPDGADRLAIRP